MSQIVEIISSNYQNSSKLIALIRKYEFELFLNQVLTEAELAKDDFQLNKLSELATTTLVKLNENLRDIETEEKEHLEYLLSDIFQSYLTTIESTEILSSIQSSLENTCNVLGYNYSVLEQLLGLKKQAVLKPKLNSNKKLLPYYEWLGLEYELDGLLDFLFKKKIIYSKKEFRKLFFPIFNQTTYRSDKNRVSDLVIIFSILKSKSLIRPKVNSGHFSPLVSYGVDKEGGYLFEKSPNKLHEYLKRDNDRYVKMRDKYESEINDIVERTLRQRVDNGQ